MANGVGLWLDLVRVPPSGTWARRRADVFASAEDWLGPLRPSSIDTRPLIFNTKTPHSVNTFIVDGVVAGTWHYEGGGVRYEPFGRLSRATRAELDDEAERLAVFHS